MELDAADLAMDYAETDEMLRPAASNSMLRASRSCSSAPKDGRQRCTSPPSRSKPAAGPQRTGAAFRGDDRLVVDYLRDEFIANLGEREARFINRTSILDELSGELCDAVLETEGSGSMLRHLARTNALVTSLDSTDRSFRYHALLREMLASEFHSLNPREEADLHARAASWHAERNDYDRAVPHAIATGDAGIAGPMIWSQAAICASTGREATLLRWLDKFTTGQTESSALLSLARATYWLTLGNGAEIPHWTACATIPTRGSTSGEAEAIRVAAGAIEASGAARDGVVSMRAKATRAFELLPAEDPFRSLCRLLRAPLTISPAIRARPPVAEGGLRPGATAASDRQDDHPRAAAPWRSTRTISGRDFRYSIAQRASELIGLRKTPTQGLVCAVAAWVAATAPRRGRIATPRGADWSTTSSPWYEAETRIVIATLRSSTISRELGPAPARGARDLRQIRTRSCVSGSSSVERC